MKKILIIGGTRNMGYSLALTLLDAGHQVTVLNRGMSQDKLPEAIHRLRADRTDPQQMKRALLAKHFDVVVDFVLYNGREAQTVVDLLRDMTGHYIFISTGQVYLVRQGIERPFSEDEYAGRLLPPPKTATFAESEYDYGLNKRKAEDVLRYGHTEFGFPFTSLRLPMVNSEWDPFRRLYSYYLRLRDGGPILLPQTPNYPLRHVYAADVVQAIVRLIDAGAGQGRAYNITQDETVSMDEFLALLASIMDVPLQTVRVKRSLMEANGFLPDASPFSERWMSELTNERSKAEIGMVYTPLVDYLEKLVRHHDAHPIPAPVSYKRRPAEIRMAEQGEMT